MGFREGYGEAGYTIRPTGLINRLRIFSFADYQAQRDGSLISRRVSGGTGMDGQRNSFLRIWGAFDRVRSGSQTFPRRQLLYIVQISPSRAISQISLDGWIGEEIDFANSRPGSGGNVNLSATVRPTDHLELRANASRRWLNVDAGTLGRGRLFTASVARLRATYTFTARSFLRIIGQYVETQRDPSLYLSSVSAKDGSFSGSALFAYKLNWQTVMFVGYGDNRTLVDGDQYAKADRQFFLKLSYAFQM